MRSRWASHERVDADIKGVSATFEFFEGGRDIVSAPDLQHGEFEPERLGRCLHLAQFHHRVRKVCIGHDRPTAETWDKLAQEFRAVCPRYRSPASTDQ